MRAEAKKAWQPMKNEKMLQLKRDFLDGGIRLFLAPEGIVRYHRDTFRNIHDRCLAPVKAQDDIFLYAAFACLDDKIRGVEVHGCPPYHLDSIQYNPPLYHYVAEWRGKIKS